MSLRLRGSVGTVQALKRTLNRHPYSDTLIRLNGYPYPTKSGECNPFAVQLSSPGIAEHQLGILPLAFFCSISAELVLGVPRGEGISPSSAYWA